MKLDRNTNRAGRGKYALVNMRKLIPVMEEAEATEECLAVAQSQMVKSAFELLVSKGLITLGNESPGDQFFVMKYKDKFTHAGLKAYADAVSEAAFCDIDDSNGLHQYASEIYREAMDALRLGNRIPD